MTALLALGAAPAIEGVVSSISFPDTKYKCTPLLLAARDGHVGIVRVLLAHEQVDANQASSDAGKTALRFACAEGHTAAAANVPLPLLPIELWLFAMRFFKRSWWAVEGVTA